MSEHVRAQARSAREGYLAMLTGGGVTYEGPIRWEGHSGIKATGPPTFDDIATDDDYNIDLVPPDRAGFVQGDERIHMEFDSDETIDHFRTPFWTALHSAVDAEDSRALALPGTSPQDLLNNKCAIAIGVMGLDCAHGCGTELYPLLALAVHLRDDPQDDQWMIFARNWGNAGYCSTRTETADNMVTLTFRVPRPGATAVKKLDSTQFLTRKGQAGGPIVTLLPNEGALVTLTMPLPASEERIHGDLHLQWTGASHVTTCPMRSMARLDSSMAFVRLQNIEPEAKIRDLIARLSPEQRRVFNASLKAKSFVADQVLPTRQMASRVPAPRRRRVDPALRPAQVLAGTPKVRNVSDADRARQQQAVLQALKKAYGGQIPGFPPENRRSR